MLNRAVLGYLQGITVIRGYLRAGSDYDRAKEAIVHGAELQQTATSGPLRWLVAAMSAATALAAALLVPGAGLGYAAGEVDLAIVVLFLLLGLGYLSPVIALVGTMATIMTRIQLSAEAVRQILESPELPEPGAPCQPETFEASLLENIRIARAEASPATGGDRAATYRASDTHAPESHPARTPTEKRTTTVESAAPARAAGDAEPIERHGVGAMGFFQQWRTLYGRSWRPMLRQGLVRLIVESLFRGAPLIAVLALILAAIGELPGVTSLDSGLVQLITGLLLIGLLARVASSVWVNALIWRLAARSKADLQLSVIDQLRRVPLGFFQRVDTGRVGTLVTNDIPMVDFQNLPQQVVGALIQPVYAMIILAIIDWRLALAALVGLPVFWALTAWSDRIYHRVFADLHHARQQATAAMLEQARGAAVLRGNPRSRISRRYESVMEDLADASTAMSVRATPASSLGSVAVESGQVVLIAVGAALFANGAVSAATLLIFLMLSLTIYQPIQELNALAGYRRNQQQIAKRIGEVWDAPTLSEPAEPAAPEGSAVELREVLFSYTDGEPTLHNVSLRAEERQITALVGASGSGKSTIASLVSRLWEADAGAVTIGGADVRDLGSTGVLQAVTTVFQEVYLFDETVRFNVTLGRPDASDDQVWEALRAAQCEDVVAALPDGLDTVLSDGGSDLSGGRRQRMAIARALLKDTPVLVLDEAVAAVDPGTEDRIQEALSTLAAGRTVIVIAHRISTIEQAHRIIVVERGAVAGCGTHHELLDTCEAYHALAAAQDPDDVELANTGTLKKEH